MSKVYETFAAQGAHDCDVAKRWEAYGVESSFEEETKTLALKLPKGWVSTMTDEEHKATEEGWCIDEATYNVDYELHLSRANEFYRVEKLVVVEIDKEGSIEFSTSAKPGAFKIVEGALPGTTLEVKLVATAKLASGESRTLDLIEGTLTFPAEPVALGNNTPGVFVVVAGGFALFAHYDVSTPGAVSHMALMGKMGGLELEFTKEI
jgi:hypothetical protein